MNPIIGQSGETELLIEQERVIGVDGLETWQIDSLKNSNTEAKNASAHRSLMQIDKIVTEWLDQLSSAEWQKIKRQKSLHGITIPKDWIKVWRFILKEPKLRNSLNATKNGRNVGTYSHLWNIWAEQCIDKYLNDLEKEFLKLVDAGYPYLEIGVYMLKKYGKDFWKKRKENSKTTPAQVVNGYLYIKLPTKIARAELTDIALKEIKNRGY